MMAMVRAEATSGILLDLSMATAQLNISSLNKTMRRGRCFGTRLRTCSASASSGDGRSAHSGSSRRRGLLLRLLFGRRYIYSRRAQSDGKEDRQDGKKKDKFERIAITKEEALELFGDNPFKLEIINAKVDDGAWTTAYRNGTLVDLCKGPHVANTGIIKALRLTKHSASHWLGDADNDALQRAYGVSFPTKKLMKEYQETMKAAKERDHRAKGIEQELFFFNELSPGSAFFLPHGARIYNTLMAYMRSQYRKRGYEEVITPNVFNVDLWKQSGHWDHYQENMFTFSDGEAQAFALKPMNCPSHCVMFNHRPRSYRELPIRFADFGVLHRNELSGALSGLTRVRRFQQDDAHIFARPDQMKQEVLGALDFMKSVYDSFGMPFELERSTRPEKRAGSTPRMGSRFGTRLRLR